jgi:hypothetical protein
MNSSTNKASAANAPLKDPRKAKAVALVALRFDE